MAFLCPARIRRAGRKKRGRKDPPPPLPGRITGSASIDTLVRIGLEKEHYAAADGHQRRSMTLLHDFVPCVEDELAVRRGETVSILYQENDWVYAIGADGREGFIPFVYCVAVGRSVDDLQAERRRHGDARTSIPDYTGLGAGVGGEAGPAPADDVGGGAWREKDDVSGAWREKAAGGSCAVQRRADDIGGGNKSGGQTTLREDDIALRTDDNSAPSPLYRRRLQHHQQHHNQQQHHHHHQGAPDENDDEDPDVRPEAPLLGQDRRDAEWPRYENLLVHCRHTGSGIGGNDNVASIEVVDIRTFHKQEAGRFTVLFAYSAKEEGDVSVDRGDLVTGLNTDDPDWFWVAKSDLTEGFVPSNFLRPAGSEVAKTTRGKLEQQTATSTGSSATSICSQPVAPATTTELVVLYDYTTQAPDDISVTRGEWVYADLSDQPEKDWLWVYAPATARFGFMPKEFAKPPGIIRNTTTRRSNVEKNLYRSGARAGALKRTMSLSEKRNQMPFDPYLSP